MRLILHRTGLAAAILLLAATLPAAACLWDSDTLATEAKGIPGVIDVIAGRFDRNPPLYYEMRLQRVAAALEQDPDDLAAYDDAGVACDRLGRSDEAIAWMEKKLARMDAMDASDPGVRDHRYRYLANVGTFWAHRWVRNGADRDKLDELRRARDFIAKAIELNPEAHFGREKYQLKVMEWLLDPPPADGREAQPPYHGFPDCIDLRRTIARAAFGPDSETPSIGRDALLQWEMNNSDAGVLPAVGYGDAPAGLAGLIVLGNAWESVDVFYALALALEAEGKSSPSELALYRVRDLIDQGRGSLHPQASTGEKLWEQLRFDPMAGDLRSFYAEARDAADERNRARESYMLARLEAGRHPDTDASFWSEWEEPVPPALPDTNEQTRTAQHTTRFVGALLAALTVSAAGVAFLVYRVVRHLRGAPPEPAAAQGG